LHKVYYKTTLFEHTTPKRLKMIV